MNERVKKLWIEALTSGEYEQGTGQLRDGDKFCCLGVLEDLRKREAGLKWKPTDYGSIVLSASTCKWADLKERDPKMPSSVPHLHTLAVINDQGTPFPEIAKLIEANL